MKIPPDGIPPRKLVAVQRDDGREAVFAVRLRVRGLDIGRLYRVAASRVAAWDCEPCLARGPGVAHNARQWAAPAGFELLRAALPQKPQERFAAGVPAAFRAADLSRRQPGGGRP